MFPYWTLAVAMDCSAIAATQHLQAASNALLAFAGTQFEPFCKTLAKRYKALAPSEELALPGVKQIVGRWIWPRRIARTIAWIVLLAFVAAAAYAAHRIVPMLEF